MDRIIFLIRHGNVPDNSADPPVISNTDQELSERGVEQVTRLAGNLRSRKLVSIYCSPLRRAWQTGTIIREHQQCSVPMNMRRPLQEINHGRWGGCTWAEVADRWSAEYAMFQQDPATYGYVGGENLQQVQSRMTRIMYEIVAEAPAGTLAVVSHKQAIRAFLSYIAGVPLRRCRDIDQFEACVNVLRFQGGVFQLGAVNQSLVADDLVEAE